jgi:alpha-L-fucosidase
LFIHAYFWPGETLALGGLQQKVLSAKVYRSGQPVKFEQEQFRVRFLDLPASAPDPIATVLAVECDGEPTQDQLAIRIHRKRESV